MTKKSGIVLLGWWITTIVIVASIVLKTIDPTKESFYNIMRIIWIVYSILYILVSIIERVVLNKQLNQSSHDLNEMINVLEKAFKRSFTQSSVNICTTNLFMFYLIQGDVEKSKKMYNLSPVTKRTKKCLYPIIVLNVIEGNIEEAENCLKMLENINHPMFAQQLDSARRLIIAAKTGRTDPELAQKTKYQSIKNFLNNLEENTSSFSDDIFS